MHRLHVSALAVLTALLVGCGEETVPPEQSYDPQQDSGEVDASLPQALQVKQRVLQGVLNELQTGTEVEFLRNYLPDVRFQETQEKFDEGTLGVARWDFGGKPTGNDVPVVLWLSLDSSGKNEKKVERIYSVGGSAGAYTIARKKAAP